MRAIVESLKRLYEAGRLTRAQLLERVDKGTITVAEHEQIVGEEEQGA